MLPLLTDPPPVPADAEYHLTQIRWFLDAFAGDGARLDFLKLTEKPTLTPRSALTATGRTAAITAVLQYADRPRHQP